MNLPESVMSESLDEIIRRSGLRLEQERLHVAELRAGGPLHASAKARLRTAGREGRGIFVVFLRVHRAGQEREGHGEQGEVVESGSLSAMLHVD